MHRVTAAAARAASAGLRLHVRVSQAHSCASVLPLRIGTCRSLNVARICSARHDSASRGISVDTPSDTVGAGGFHQLGVPSHCIGRLQRAGFVKPLAVQQAFVPNVLKEPERDFVLHAETGTGKTLAYLVPVLAALPSSLSHRTTTAVVVVPTRELALQVEHEAARLFAAPSKKLKHKAKATAGRHTRSPAKPVVVRRATGRASARLLESLKRDRPDVLVGTPQTLASILGTDALPAGSLGIVVLDEVDALADKHNLPATTSVLEILRSVAQPPQLLFVSATTTPEAQQLCTSFLRPASKYGVVDFTNGAYSVPSSLTHLCLRLPRENQRLPAVTRLFAALRPSSVIAFAESAASALAAGDALRRKNLRVAELVGPMHNKDRALALKRIQSGLASVLLSTDMLSRGLDLPGLSHAFNLSVPDSARQYLHRAGRVGRQGRSGTVVTIAATDQEATRMKKIAQDLGISVRFVELERGMVREVST